MRAVVVSFDRLPLGFLGCGGNTWVDTPHFDRLATEGVLFDQHFAECIGPAASHAWWTGCRQFPAEPGGIRGGEFMARLREAGVRTTLLTEMGEGTNDGRATSLPGGFQEVEPISGADGLDVDPAVTPFARLVERAEGLLSEAKEQADERDWLVWLKSRGVPCPWLPPREFAERYVALFEELDEEDDEPSDVEEDLEWVAVDADPDEDDDEWEEGDEEGKTFEDAAAEDEEQLDEQEEFDAMLRALAGVGEMERTDGLDESDWLLVRAVYGGYVSLLDRGLGRLRRAIADHLGEDALLIVTAAEGESLGERIGMPEGPGPLGEERVHTPLLVAFPEAEAGRRCRQLVDTTCLAPTLLDWFRVNEPDGQREGDSLLPILRAEVPDRTATAQVCGGTDGDGSEARVGLRTEDTYFVSRISAIERLPSDEGAHAVEGQLFAKPEDVWEIHDVASQRPQDVHSMAVALAEFLTRSRSTCPTGAPAWPASANNGLVESSGDSVTREESV